MTNLVFAYGDGEPVHRHIDVPDIGNCCVSAVIVPLADREWHQAIQVSAGLGDDILAGALVVEVVSVKCVVVGVTPAPTRARVLRNTDGLALLNFALLLDPTIGVLTGI